MHSSNFCLRNLLYDVVVVSALPCNSSSSQCFQWYERTMYSKSSECLEAVVYDVFERSSIMPFMMYWSLCCHRELYSKSGFRVCWRYREYCIKVDRSFWWWVCRRDWSLQTRPRSVMCRTKHCLLYPRSKGIRQPSSVRLHWNSVKRFNVSIIFISNRLGQIPCKYCKVRQWEEVHRRGPSFLR